MSALMARVARLDADQVFWGLGEPVALEQLQPGDRVFGDPALAPAIAAAGLQDVVWIDRDCDLAGGRYRLVAPDAQISRWRFEPLPPQLQKRAEQAPDLERAFYETAKALHVASGAIAPATLSWALAYEKSFDAVAAPGVDTPAALALTYFRDLQKGG